MGRKCNLKNQRAVRSCFVKRERFFQMPSGSRKLAGKHQVSAGGVVPENQPGSIVALTAHTQQTLGQALGQSEVAAQDVIGRLPVGNLKEPRGITQLLPQLVCARISLARLRRRSALDGNKDGTLRTAKSELLSLVFRGVRQQRQLVQSFLQLRCRFRHCRAGGRPPAGLAPIDDRFFDEPSLGINVARKARVGFP